MKRSLAGRREEETLEEEGKKEKGSLRRLEEEKAGKEALREEVAA